MLRTILFSTVAVIAMGGAAAGFLFLDPAGKPAEAADPRVLDPLVRVVTAKTPDTAERGFTGTVAARVQSNLGFRVPGKIVERLVELGETVKAGQPMMRIDDTDLRLALSAKRNAAAAARATFVQADADEKRYAVLVKSNLAASPQRYEQAKATLDAAAAQLAAAEAEAAVAENEASYATLVADADGTIVETLGEPGQVVSAGQPVLRLAKAGPREGLISLPETLRPPIGTRASATLYGKSAPVEAVLRQISDAADPLTRTYETRWVLKGEASRAPLGATVTIRLANSDVAAHAEVPLGALIDDGSRTGVFVLDGTSSRVSLRPVKVERVSEESVVVSDVKAGETVVALGVHLLSDGAIVRTAAQATEASR